MIEFTKEQQSVIDARDSNILVSAAAGSGKTAVLVERIIQMIRAGLDVDHLLVVTFTKAAASQMKEKITSAIEKALLEDPENAHLQRQETLIHNAQITTIDAFCQYVIRNDFNSIGIDPSFRVADEGELKILMEDVMAELMEDEYVKAGDDRACDFLFCMDYFSPGRTDSKVEEYVYQLFKFSMSMPWPEDWIRERAEDYNIGEEDFDSLPWVKDCMAYAGSMLLEALATMDSALRISLEPDGPYMYADMLESEKDAIRRALEQSSYDDLLFGIRDISFARLPSKKDDSVNADKREYVKELRNKVKDDIGSLQEDYFVLDKGTIVSQMKLCDRAVRELCSLTLEFKRRFDEKKRQMQLIDFSDMEHFALQILIDHEKNEPTAAAMEYREFYREVLIDEYQDSNNVQEMILMAIAGSDTNVSERFMVGDVKQSIYKFRLARPELFMEKFHSYARSEKAADRRIDLHKNFRSRHEVLDITNYIFEKIMGADLGGVDYDLDARLIAGAVYDEPLMDVSPEFMIYDNSLDPSDDENSALSKLVPRQKEALAIAERINRLRQENPALKYSDIVILLRSLSGWDDVFKEILQEQGIPVYIESKSGYFESPEVAVLLQMLSVIDNPRQDIPLVAVMHSAIGGFSDEEMALIKIAINECGEASSDSFYDGMCCDIVLEDELKGKMQTFLDMIERFRVMTTYTPVHELLLELLDETDFETYVTAMPGGNQRRANVEMLLGYAENFEKTSFKGLFHFVRYIEHMRVSMVDYGEAGIIDETADVVRIMSIHKSKGLEFPVVFVSGLSKKFNRMDTTGDVILDMDLGIGVKHIDSDLRVRYDTLKRRIISDKMGLDSLGEEIRVLYVALTRAKEKLILTAAVDDLSKELTKAVRKLPVTGAGSSLLPYSSRSRAGSFFDLILPALIKHPCVRPLLEKYECEADEFDIYSDKGDVPALSICSISDRDLEREMVEIGAKGILRGEDLKRNLESDYDKDLFERLRARFTAVYPHENLRGLFTKTTVSELKKARIRETFGEAIGEGERALDKEDYRADDLRKESDDSDLSEVLWFEEGETLKSTPHLKGAERGTAYHRVMELLDDDIYGDESFMEKTILEEKSDHPGPSSKRIYAWLKGKVTEGMISAEAADAVWTTEIVKFLKADIGQRMGRSFRRGKLRREQPFMMGVHANELDPGFPEEEMVLVQGIIDAFFVEDGEIVLLDYKTDRVKDEKTLIDLYKVQLELYKRALESATGMKVKESLIYSFALAKQIRLD